MKEKTKLIVIISLIILGIVAILVVQKHQSKDQQSKTQAQVALIKSIQKKVYLIDLEKNYKIKTLDND